MMELEKLSGTQLGRLVNQGVISPAQVVEYFRNRIETRNPSLNAFVYTEFDEAARRAEQLEQRLARGEDCGPLAGVPQALSVVVRRERRPLRLWRGGNIRGG